MTPSARPTLLIVDDEPDVLRSLHDLFRRDYQVVTFERASDAIEGLETLAPRVVMSDQRMPGMTGVEFLRAVRERLPAATRLLFTGYADLDAVIDAINEGHVFRYVSKPWDPQELIAIVRQSFEQNALVSERLRLIAELQQTNRRLAEADRLKAAFIEVASHELNTPVAIILGLADLWSMKHQAQALAQDRDWVERIRRAGQRLASIVKRMFELTSTDRLSETLSAEPTELAVLIRRVVDEVRPFLESRRQRLELDLDAELGSAVVDPAKLGDVLTNLIANAIKFTPDERIITVKAAPEGIDRVCLEVSDHGVGIPPEELAHVFEPFFTGFDTRHHSSGEMEFCKRGIGLGLPLARRLVELHHGEIEAQSQPGRGTTIVVRLPRRQPQEGRREQGGASEATRHSGGSAS
jgi:signal transduction histidine kinase